MQLKECPEPGVLPRCAASVRPERALSVRPERALRACSERVLRACAVPLTAPPASAVTAVSTSTLPPSPGDPSAGRPWSVNTWLLLFRSQCPWLTSWVSASTSLLGTGGLASVPRPGESGPAQVPIATCAPDDSLPLAD